MAENKEPVRIGMVIGKMNNGGVESVVFNYYKNIDRDKVQFDFFVDSDSSVFHEEKIKALGGNLYIIPPYQKLGAYLKTLEKHFRENNYKIVHSNINTLSVFPLYAAKKAGVPIRIIHNHSTAGKGETKKNIMKYMLRPFAKTYATNYIACSEYAGDWIFGKKFMSTGKVTVLRNAIDLGDFSYNPDLRKTVRDELGLKATDFVIGHVGRYCYQKNHDFLIDIFKRVHDKNKNAVLLLIGSGELVDEVNEKIQSLGLTDCVKSLGIRNDVNRIYQAMDVFALPSRYEGLPVVGVEAQACGLPCVLSDAMTKETQMLDSTVMLSLDKSADEWADAILSYENFDRYDTSQEMREHGFDIAEEGKKLSKYYEDVLKSGENK